MPRRLAEIFLLRMPLRIVPLPVPPLSFQIQLLWYDRTDADEGAKFFRSLVQETVRRRR